MQVELPMSRKRRLEPHTHGAELRATKKRLTQAMGELALGSPPAPAPEFGHPFGVRTRMRAPSVSSLGNNMQGAALESLETLKRALEPGAVETTESAPKRQRSDSRALVVYRPPIPATDILLQSATSPSPTTTPAPLVRTITIPPEFMTVANDAITEPNTNSNADEDGDLELEPTGLHEALVRVPSLAERRRAAYIRAAMEANSLVRTQNVFLMPWRETNGNNSNNNGQTGNYDAPPNSPQVEDEGDMSDMDVA